MDIKNYICPVCKNGFNDSSDAVFCPECGTPHHRECWAKNGKCFNENLHGSPEIEKTYISSENTQELEKPAEPLKVEIKEDAKKFGPFSLEIKEPELKINPAQTFLIDGKPGVLYEVAVRKNQRYYIPTFMAISQTNKKAISWNFWAFLVPLAWSVYRKMYKLSAIILAVYMLIIGVGVYHILSNEELAAVTNQCIEENPYFLEDISLYLSGGDATLTTNQQRYIEEIEKSAVPGAVSTAFSVLLIGCRCFMGLMANKEYMKSIKRVIEKGERAGLTDDKLKNYIYKKRGIIPIAIPVIIGILEFLTIYY